MGKPYEIELCNLNQTYQWSFEVPIEKLCAFVKSSHDLPMVAVGSGGSLTAAHMAAFLHQRTGMIAKAITPLELISSGNFIRENSVLFLSAGGRNKDILSAFRFAVTSEPRQLMALCTRKESPLKRLSNEFRWSCFLDFDLPTGKDGFLATNSLLAFNVILIRAYKEIFMESYTFPKYLPSTQEIFEQLNASVQPLLKRDVWVVLYGGWGLPAAIDSESKFTEAALKHIQLADYRNFAHGRHYWLAKRGEETGVVALITPDERKIAAKTLDLLPENIPLLHIVTDRSGPVGALELLVKTLHLVYLVGIACGIDPGMPKVPTFGRRIYRLGISLSDRDTTFTIGLNSQMATAIIRKSRYSSIKEMKVEDINYWKKAYQEYISRLESISFGSVIFDYDGTLCDLNERYKGPPTEIGQELVRLLRGGIIIGIATGRGKSVRFNLQRLIPKEYWKQVLIGYYNGSDIAFLNDETHPDKARPLDASIKSIKDALESHEQFCRIAKYECRPKQITVEPVNVAIWKKTKAVLFDIINKNNVPGVQVLESGHSIDVLAPGVSKLHLVKACEEAAKQAGNPGVALCIGDKGEWPGNDYDLLSTPYSISVDTVSPDPASCWNLSQAGHRGVQATMYYLQSMFISNYNSFKFSLKRRKPK
ncbi:MAG: HAD hydrolase family protein [Armatimonadetes bacterium]|nr:HAD hydrolase family protein [Armatimonadota bacterium]